MCEAGCKCGQKKCGDAVERADRVHATTAMDCADAMEQVVHVLHSLCQPLTTLQCRLEMAGLVDTLEAYRETVNVGLGECARLVDGVEALRGIVSASRVGAAASAPKAG